MKPLPLTTKMNKTEANYAQILELEKRAGNIITWYFEALKFRLADGCFYLPDFLVVYKDRYELHEVKGFFRTTAKVKLKVASELYPYFKWKVVRLIKGNWQVEEV